MTKQIPLTQGQFATVSDEDYDYLMQWKWCASKRSDGVRKYVATRLENTGGKWKTILMHRVVLERMGFDLTGLHSDHIKPMQTLNNTRDNLRVADRYQSGANKDKLKNNTSGYIGVSWYKRGGKWVGKIRVKRRLIHLGYFTCKHEAARAYNQAAILYHGEFAVLNEISPHLSDSVL